jgi:hypothetical protein
MKALAFVISVWIAVAIGSEAVAYAVVELSSEQKVRLSTLVVVGRVTSLRHVAEGGLRPSHYARVNVETALKGNAPATVELFLEQNIAELESQCCAVGARYLLFLRPIKTVKTARTGIYEPVNAKYGIYRLN